uniref:Uncharacterized protein n=1 Tax=viral metagenome TaxID=1070528 RepID=A0A6C0LZU2_9ZZZZ
MVDCNPFTNPYMRTFLASFLAVTASKSDLGIPEIDQLYRNIWYKLAVIGMIVYLNSCDLQVTAVIMGVLVAFLYYKKKIVF